METLFVCIATHLASIRTLLLYSSIEAIAARNAVIILRLGSEVSFAGIKILLVSVGAILLLFAVESIMIILRLGSEVSFAGFNMLLVSAGNVLLLSSIEIVAVGSIVAVESIVIIARLGDETPFTRIKRSLASVGTLLLSFSIEAIAVTSIVTTAVLVGKTTIAGIKIVLASTGALFPSSSIVTSVTNIVIIAIRGCVGRFVA